MSVESEILRIQHNIADAYAAVSEKGGEVPLQPTSANLAAAVESIPGSGASAGEVYSTEETKIGTWIDGKPLYRRIQVFASPNQTNADRQVGDTIPNVDTVVELRGSMLLSNGYTCELPYISGGNSAVLQFYFGDGINKQSMYITHSVFADETVYSEMKYTKTTDQATVELPTALTENQVYTDMSMNYGIAATMSLDDGLENEEV